MTMTKKQTTSHRRVAHLASAPVKVRQGEIPKGLTVRAAREYLIRRLKAVREVLEAFDEADRARRLAIAPVVIEEHLLYKAIQATPDEIMRLATTMRSSRQP